jgi:hypothetical protein
MPDDMSPLDAEMAEQRHRIGRLALDWPGRGRTAGVSGSVIADQTVVCHRWLVHERQEGVGDKGAVNEQDRLAMSANLVFNLASGDKRLLHV